MSVFPTQIPKAKTLFVLWKKGELYRWTAADKDRRFWQQPLPVNAGWSLLPDSLEGLPKAEHCPTFASGFGFKYSSSSIRSAGHHPFLRARIHHSPI